MPTAPARLRCEPLEDRLTPNVPSPADQRPAAAVLPPISNESPTGDLVLGTAGSSLSVVVGRAGDPSAPVSVTVEVSGTATAGPRAADGAYTVSFAAGQTSATLTVPIAATTVAAPDEQVTIALSNPSGGGQVFDDSGTLARRVVNPNEAAVTVSAIPPSQYAGGDTTVAVSSADPNVSLSADYRTQFVPFAGYRGAVFVARGDVTGDGIGDVVAAAAINGHVKVLDGATGAEVRSFLPYPGYTGAVRVAVADVNEDGFADVITAAEVNGHVKVFDGTTGAEVSSFFAAPGYAGPVSVAVARTLGLPTGGIAYPAAVGAAAAGTGSSHAVTAYSSSYIVVAAQGQVRTFDAETGVASASSPADVLTPYTGYAGPVYVASADVNGDGVPDLITGAPNGHLKAFVGGTEVVSFLDPRGAITGVAAADADGATTDGRPTFDIVAGESALYSTYDGLTGARFPTTVSIDRLNTNFVYVG